MDQYHYTECGLDNIFLVNGFTYHDTPYGKGVSFADLDGLHREIAKCIIESPCSLIGSELRFLRVFLETTQRDLAGMMNADEQRIRRWEKARTKPIDGPADRFMRLLVDEYLNGDGSVKKMIERMAELDCRERGNLTFKEVRKKWKPAAEAMATA